MLYEHYFPCELWWLTCSTCAGLVKLVFSKMFMHSCAMFRCRENYIPSVSFPETKITREIEPFLVVLGTVVSLPTCLSYRLRSLLLHCSHISHRCVYRTKYLYPLKPALSCKNLLKSAMSLSIVSLMCICRTVVQTLSASDSKATLSSYSPSDDWNL
jgi:hypothetical protein